MQKPIVAVVGRPNVGKSTLFNRLTEERISIVLDSPGITRDRIYADCVWLNHSFTLIDTGGLDLGSENEMLQHIKYQANMAIETCDVILFIVDGKTGLTEQDKEIATLLKQSKKPIILGVNKIDRMQDSVLEIYEFYELGLGEPFAISAEQALGLGDLLDEMVSYFKPATTDVEDDQTISVAIIGKPNVGKSSLINRLTGEQRVIVTNKPGTTRDAIDTFIRHQHQNFLLIDTAGIRKKSKMSEYVEKYSLIRTLTAIERSQVCIVMIDAEQGLTDQDAKIVGLADERGKGIIIAVNKWDAIEKDHKTMNLFLKKIDQTMSFCSYAPRTFISALTGQRISQLLDTVILVSENHSMRIATGVLNEVLYEFMSIFPPPAVKGRQLKIYYMTQISVRPPTFILFVNHEELLHFSYKRYIENKLREAFGFAGTPIHFIVREKTQK